MSYQVLARKWRPQTFASVIGQEHVLTALANGLSLGRIHHAYLFAGMRGVGKTSIARLLAKGLNCEIGITATPCGMCHNCHEIEQGRFVDLIEIDAASRTKVEDTRDLLDNIQYAPARGRFKVYLIDEIHMLSRYSFNALLKTLEEPPAHVKFLLATTDSQKLPVTILSRCLQFHLKSLDVEQISAQLEHILDAENIVHETRALQLLARAAEGSMRDALSLTDQAIASGNGKLTTKVVSTMLGTLDDEQALSLIEAVIDANGEKTLSLVKAAASRGVEWEVLLVEMLTLLHRIAMLQLSPVAIGSDMAAIEQRLRDLSSTVAPTEVQLYYQMLLIGRKELPFAPDKRMGVEITLLRMLAFHPRMPLPEQGMLRQSFSQVKTDEPLSRSGFFPQSGATSSVLAARSQLQCSQGAQKPPKSEPITFDTTHSVCNTELERLVSVTKSMQSCSTPSTLDQKASVNKEIYRWKQPMVTEKTKFDVIIPKMLDKMLDHEKDPELVAKLAEEAIVRDAWAAEVSRLQLPKLLEQLALNSWKEQKGNKVYLHLRPSQRHLNSSSMQKALAKALATLQGDTIDLIIIEDDNLSIRTPLEWRQAIYEEKLAQAHVAITTDDNIQTLCQFFDAELDEESISPL